MYVQQRRSAHLQRILQTRMSLWFLLPQTLQLRNMLARVPTHITDPDRQPIPHTDNPKLRDWVLLEELSHELRCIPDREQISRRPEVFL